MNPMSAPVLLEQVISSRAVADARIRLRYQFVARGKEAHGVADRKEVFVGQYVRTGQRHEFDESQRKPVLRSEQNQRPNFVFVHAAHQDAVELDAFEAGGDGRANPRQRPNSNRHR